MLRWLETVHGRSTGSIHLSGTGLWKGQALTDLGEASEWAMQQSDRTGVFVRSTTLSPDWAGPGRGGAADSFELPGQSGWGRRRLCRCLPGGPYRCGVKDVRAAAGRAGQYLDGE